MRFRSRWQDVVVWSSSAGPSGRSGTLRLTRAARSRQIRWWIRARALLAVISLKRLACDARTRPAVRLVLAGGVLTLAGIVLPNGLALIVGMLVLVRAVAVALGVSELHRRADGKPVGAPDVAGFRTPPWW